MENLQPISIVQSSLRPLLTGDDLAIQFNRHAVGLHAELLDERAQSFGGKNLALAIDCEVHRIDTRICRAKSPVETRLAASLCSRTMFADHCWYTRRRGKPLL